jgi:hypothetical protein
MHQMLDMPRDKTPFFTLTKRRVILNLFFLFISLLTVLCSPVEVLAFDSFYAGNDILFYDKNSTSYCSPSSTGSGSTTATPKTGKYTLDQVKTFAGEPVTSTWGISDGTAEQWFLKQAGAQATIAKYGLTSSNIGAISSIVRSSKVSPVFFYLDTVNEGGGAGGFINHYGGDVAGGGPANAKRDADYLAFEATQTKGTPATGGGEPASMPTAEAKSILDSLPSGSIGVYYTQATSAVTAELEDLSGKTGGWTGLFGAPLSDSMQNIQKMGGDPMQGGSSNCAGGLTGTGMAKGVSWAKLIAANNGYGYDQPGRTTGWTKWQADPSCTNQCGSFDCSSFISAIITVAGYAKTNPEFTTVTEGAYLQQAGFTQVASSAATSANLLPGDILVTSGHTEMYVGNNQNVGAHDNEFGGIAGGQVGDQSGHEISVTNFYNDSWNAVWRAH